MNEVNLGEIKRLKFIMVIGLPGAGKSTIGKKIIEDLKSKHIKCCYQSSDNIREELFGDASIQKDADRVLYIMKARSINSLANGISVVYDATNLQADKRKQLLQRVKHYIKNVDCECVVVYSDFKVCKKRAKHRERVIKSDMIDALVKLWEMPTYKEGWSNIKIVYNLTTDQKEINIKDINIPDCIYKKGLVGYANIPKLIESKK